ncbi:hypothetical protein [Heyndrickxia ginsengihumi]|uniref:hypothetical protein n=1 Tax=Heyndrickxia ginsengihumi TaxID=363870 RepID=UPI003D1A251F
MTDSKSPNVMNGNQAVGYVILVCKEIGLSSDKVKQLHSGMLSQLDRKTPIEAEIKGQEWFQSLAIDNSDNQRVNPPKPGKVHPSALPRRSLNLRLPVIRESNHGRKLRQDNEKLIRRLHQLQSGPFGLYEVLRRIKR